METVLVAKASESLQKEIEKDLSIASDEDKDLAELLCEQREQNAINGSTTGDSPENRG